LKEVIVLYFWTAIGRPATVNGYKYNGSPYATGQLSCLFDVGVLWPNGKMDQDATWCRDRRYCVSWGPSSPPTESGTAVPHFSAHVYCDQL